MSLQCTLITTAKVPIHEDKEKKLVDFSVSKRVREQNSFLECENAFVQKFQLVDEFTKKYEYRMQGKLKEV